MKLAYVVHRYGPEVRGGAEAHCRDYALRLAALGHEIAVFTTCASDYRSWRNDLPEGTSRDDGVTVRRYPVTQERPREFDVFCAEVLADPVHVPRDVQERWMQMQGPVVPELFDALRAGAPAFDLVVFVTYLYCTTFYGLPVAGERTILQPTAHNEPTLRLPLFDDMFKIPKAFAFLTEEERAVVHGRFEISPVAEAVVGVGIERPPDVSAAERRNPYIVYLGRLDAMKGIDHLVEFFQRYRRRHKQSLDLVLVGDNVAGIREAPGIVVTGVVDEEEKWRLLAGAAVLVHPSYFESFAINLLEGWSVGVPALVNAYCDITVGHCRRAGGGLWYRSYEEFEACLDRLLDGDELRGQLASGGQRYVDSTFSWTTVLDRYTSFLESVRDKVALGRPVVT